MKTSICLLCLFISFNSFAQKTDAVTAPKVVFQECLDKPLSPDFYKGKFLILDFWATWCAPCIAGFPHFNQLADKYSNANVLFASYTIEPESIQAKFFERTKKELHAYKLSDTTKKTRDAFNIEFYPSCVIIGPDNTIRWKGETQTLTADILDKVVLKNENLFVIKPLAPISNIPATKKKTTHTFFHFNITETDTSEHISEGFGGESIMADGTPVSCNKPKILLGSFIEDVSGLSASTRILSNDSLKLNKDYNIDYTIGSDSNRYKHFSNTILPSSACKNFILYTLGSALKFDASIGSRKIKHYELIVTDTAKLHKFKPLQTDHASMDGDHPPKLEIVKHNLKQIIHYAEDYSKIIITANGIDDKGSYDVSLDVDSIDNLKKSLSVYGLALKEVTGDVPFLNIKFY